MALFLACDGDRVGAKLEALIIAEELELAASFSQNITAAIQKIKEAIECQKGFVIFIGGDNILARFDGTENPNLIINKFDYIINSIFFEITGCTMSVGVGNRPRDAFLALKLAKGSNDKKIVNLIK